MHVIRRVYGQMMPGKMVSSDGARGKVLNKPSQSHEQEHVHTEVTGAMQNEEDWISLTDDGCRARVFDKFCETSSPLHREA